MTTKRVTVWDLPIRLFHWAIVLLIAFSYVSIQAEWLDLHMLSGYAILVLLIFRLVWGLFGSETARFRNFIKSPRAAFSHLKRLTAGKSDRSVGHNPAGGLMVLVLLALLIFQTLTGLGANDDLFNEGPLAKHLGKHLSDWVSVVHSWNFDLILAASALHVVAIAAYAIIKRQNLVLPMLVGGTQLPVETASPRLASPSLATFILALSGLAVWILVHGL